VTAADPSKGWFRVKSRCRRWDRFPAVSSLLWASYLSGTVAEPPDFGAIVILGHSAGLEEDPLDLYFPATGNRQPATGNRQPATGNRQPATGNLVQC